MAVTSKMTSYFSKQQKKQKNQTDNPIEIIKDFGIGVVKSTASDVIGGIATSAMEQIGLTPTSSKSEGVLEPNQDISLGEISSAPKEEEGFFFGEKKPYRPIEQNTFTQRDAEVQQKIREILRELKSLAKSVESVNREVAKITVEQIPQTGGVYHLNFFEWILKTIKLARAKVSESALWLSFFKSRNAKKGYWQMFKKHGTSFAMSDERSVAGSVG